MFSICSTIQRTNNFIVFSFGVKLFARFCISSTPLEVPVPNRAKSIVSLGQLVIAQWVLMGQLQSSSKFVWELIPCDVVPREFKLILQLHLSNFIPIIQCNVVMNCQRLWEQKEFKNWLYVCNNFEIVNIDVIIVLIRKDG